MLAFCTSCGHPAGNAEFCTACGAHLNPGASMVDADSSDDSTLVRPPVSIPPPVPAAAMPPPLAQHAGPRRSKAGPIAIVVSIAVLLAGAAVGAILLLGGPDHRDPAQTNAAVAGTPTAPVSTTPPTPMSITCWDKSRVRTVAECPSYVNASTTPERLAVLQNVFPALRTISGCHSSPASARLLYLACSTTMRGASVCLHASWWISGSEAEKDYGRAGQAYAISGGRAWPARSDLNGCDGHAYKSAVLSADKIFGMTAYADDAGTATTAATTFGAFASANARNGH